MGKVVTIPDTLAERLEERRLATGQGSLDEVATSLMEEALGFDDEFDPNGGYTVDVLRALIAEGEASGPALEWTPGGLKAEVLRRSALRRDR